MKLQPIDFETYAETVLPLSAPLWGGERTFERYVEHTGEVARSGYGRRHYRTIGLYNGKALLASFKRYERTLRNGSERLRALGVGAVFTPPDLRGRGYASAMLAMELDRSRAEGFDLAFLFSDIRPQFYAELGFSLLPSRSISLRADSLAKTRVEVARLEERDWPGVQRCFELCEHQRTSAFVRTPLVWEWLRLRMRQGSEHPGSIETNLLVRRGRAISAYVLGARAPKHDAYILDEFGYADAEAAALIPALLRSAAGDLRRITGWLPPEPARERLPRASVRKRASALLMAAGLSAPGKRWVSGAASAKNECIWGTDHI
ncbi:MAG TPA: GNAT family N-acetyltransferase [Candidatus Baltobacteraceae bacterium]|nr:GNAT family N-acetyltransferase [Candidatus Baltobacteraceae bacterium]